MRIRDCAVNSGDPKIIVPRGTFGTLKRGMAIFGAPVPAGALVTNIGEDWFEISKPPRMTWFGDLIAA